MASVRDIFVRLGIRTDPKGFKRANAGITKLKTNALSLGRLFIGGAVAIGFKKLIDVASDIEETANKFGAVFGEAGSTVQKQLDEISKSTGATTLELQTMASGIGALIKPSLGSAAAAGKMATQISELALDIASFNNVSSDDAIVALRSGLIGSAEPLQRFGVDTRIAALQQEALRQGITASVQAMTEGQRVALRFAVIQRQLGVQGATGDATRTSKDFANASRNLGKAMKEVSGIIGTFFLGTTSKLVNRLRDVIDTIRVWLKENKALIQQNVGKFFSQVGRVLRSTISVVNRAIDAFQEWRKGLSPLGNQLVKISLAIAGLALLLLLPGVGILLLIGLVALLIDDFETWRKGGQSVIGDLVRAFKDFGKGITNQLGIFKNWIEEHQTGIRLVTSLFAALATIIGTKLLIANAAAIGSFLVLKAAAISAAVAAIGPFLALAAASISAAVSSAAAWLVATLPLLLTAAALAIIIGTLVFLGAELVRLASGQDNFFTTMFTGISDLIGEWGGVGPAIRAMLEEALRFWLRFFGQTQDETEEWIENLTKTLIDFWPNVLDFWRGQVSDFFGVDGPTANITAPSAVGATNVANAQTNNISVNVTAAPGMNEALLAEMIPQEIAKAQERENRQAARAFATEAP